MTHLRTLIVGRSYTGNQYKRSRFHPKTGLWVCHWDFQAPDGTDGMIGTSGTRGSSGTSGKSETAETSETEGTAYSLSGCPCICLLLCRSGSYLDHIITVFGIFDPDRSTDFGYIIERTRIISLPVYVILLKFLFEVVALLFA